MKPAEIGPFRPSGIVDAARIQYIYLTSMGRLFIKNIYTHAFMGDGKNVCSWGCVIRKGGFSLSRIRIHIYMGNGCYFAENTTTGRDGVTNG